MWGGSVQSLIDYNGGALDDARVDERIFREVLQVEEERPVDPASFIHKQPPQKSPSGGGRGRDTLSQP